MNRAFWRRRRVLITGHTGFKGAWLTSWLKESGAEVSGFALAPPTTPNLFDLAGGAEGMRSIQGDVRDEKALRDAYAEAKPEVVIHLAAQSLVRPSYEDPIGTYGTNVMGTVHLLECVRRGSHTRVVVVVTSDKCYENREWLWPYRENEPMGGGDPYSSSKGCAELVTAAYRSSFFSDPSAARISTVRAGNVIGGGDWSRDRLVPDLVRGFSRGTPVLIRNPNAIRPWQFVLDPLNGYLELAERLWDDPSRAGAWNFGPQESEVKPVRWVADRLAKAWGSGAEWRSVPSEGPHEATILKLDSSRARTLLGWEPRLPLDETVSWIADFHKALGGGEAAEAVLRAQVSRFESLD